jgi:hypothetical protein
MATVIVEHEWNAKDGEKVFKIVGSIVEMSKTGKLPKGFSLKSVDVIAGSPRAICRWEAPSAEALSGLLGQVNPPTTHRVVETQKVL